MDDQLTPVERAVSELGARDSRVLVAVSGGPDSVALLHALVYLSRREASRISLRIAHVNHQLRGADSENDEQFVRALGDELGLAVDVARVSVTAHAAEQRVSLETAARELRYEALESMLRLWPGDVIATGHTADDQAETVIMRLLRGAGSAGLGGVAPRRDHIVRPFLSVTHQEVLAYLETNAFKYRLDASNLDIRYTRNRIRHELMPLLERWAPGAVRRMGRTADILRDESEYLAGETSRALTHLNVRRDTGEVSADLAVWRTLHPALRRSILRSLAVDVAGERVEISSGYVAAMQRAVERAGKNGIAHIHRPGVLDFWVCDGRLHFRRECPARRPAWESADLTIPGAVSCLPGMLEAQREDFGPSPRVARALAVQGPFQALCDAGRLGKVLTVRPRLPGDRMRFAGRNGSRKLQDVFVDSHVPAAVRDSLAVVSDEEGPVWLPGFGVDRRVAATVDSGTIVRLRFVPNPAIYHARMPQQFRQELPFLASWQFGE